MSDEEAITAARIALNAAIAARDAEAIAAILAEAYHVVTALNTQRSGREESRRSWAAMFADDPSARFERITRRIDVNPAVGMAHESGEWNGTFRNGDHQVTAGGMYSAKWQRGNNGNWLLLAEIFTPL